MFTVLEKGDRMIQRAKRKAVVLVGKSRVGKSCSFNWIKKIPMVGSGFKKLTFYKKKVVGKDSMAAEESNGLTSTTLIPNI